MEPRNATELAQWADFKINYLAPIVRRSDIHPPADEADEVRRVDQRCRELAPRLCPGLKLEPHPPAVVPESGGIDCRVILANLRAVRGWCEDQLEPSADDGPEVSKANLALAILADHPEWSDKKIAEEAGCSRTSLYRWPKYRKAREILKAGKEAIPRGEKSAEGDMEAWK